MHSFSLSFEGPGIWFILKVGKQIFEKQVKCGMAFFFFLVLFQKKKINRLIQLLKHNFNLKVFFLIRFNVCHALPVILHSREFVQRFPVRMSLLHHAWQLQFSHRGMLAGGRSQEEKHFFHLSHGINPSPLHCDSISQPSSLLLS